jgi:hypothetical protein
MNDQYQFEDGEVVALAEKLGDEKRLALIAKVIGMNTPQSRRIAECLMAIHLHERKKCRDVVDWALGSTTKH